MTLTDVLEITNHISANILGHTFIIYVAHDVKMGVNGRIFIQVIYDAPCTKTNEITQYKGRKWYLSDHMINDEIVKTAYCAFKAAVEHEVMEGFKFDNKVVFNPHVSFRDLLLVSDKEVKRN